MTSDLDTLKTQIQNHLDSEEFVVFHGFSRMTESLPPVFWDTLRYPDFQQFLMAPKELGVKMISFHHRELEPNFVDDALADLETVDMPAAQSRKLSQRLRDLKLWEGFTSVVELSFSHEGQVYIFSRRADWYEEIMEIADEIDDYLSVEEEGEDQTDAMGGYFSRN
ncbi:MAG: hypothetical protein GY953_35955 [bacterium]|nr:hypothetical protein [bacterium]